MVHKKGLVGYIVQNSLDKRTDWWCFHMSLLRLYRPKSPSLPRHDPRCGTSCLSRRSMASSNRGTRYVWLGAEYPNGECSFGADSVIHFSVSLPHSAPQWARHLSARPPHPHSPIPFLSCDGIVPRQRQQPHPRCRSPQCPKARAF